jgi:hypothetical protein
MATREEQIAAWEEKGYPKQTATQIVDDLEGPAAPPLKTVPIAPKKTLAPGQRTHHENCGDVGATGDHGELGSNAGTGAGGAAVPVSSPEREGKIAAYLKAGYSREHAEAFVK